MTFGNTAHLYIAHSLRPIVPLYTNKSCPLYASTHCPVCAVNNESLRLSNLGSQSILEPKQSKQSSRQLNLLHQNTLFLDRLHLAGSRMFYILGWIVECPIKLKSISYNGNTFPSFMICFSYLFKYKQFQITWMYIQLPLINCLKKFWTVIWSVLIFHP